MTQPSSTNPEKPPTRNRHDFGVQTPVNVTDKPEQIGVEITRWKSEGKRANGNEVDTVKVDSLTIPNSKHESPRDVSWSHHVSSTDYSDGSNETVVAYRDGAEVRTVQRADGTTTVTRIHYNGEIFSTFSLAAPLNFNSKVITSQPEVTETQSDQ